MNMYIYIYIYLWVSLLQCHVQIYLSLSIYMHTYIQREGESSREIDTTVNLNQPHQVVRCPLTICAQDNTTHDWLSKHESAYSKSAEVDQGRQTCTEKSEYSVNTTNSPYIRSWIKQVCGSTHLFQCSLLS